MAASCSTAPEKLVPIIGVRQNRTFRHADGILSPAEFVARVRESSDREGRAFDPPRYFIEADELIVSNGRTYAFTKMWGAETEHAMGNLVNAFPQHRIGFTPSDLTA